MIKIPFTYNGATPVPQRKLTDEELKAVTSKLINGGTMEIIYYQGDEPPKEVIENPVPEKVDMSNIDVNSIKEEDLQMLADKLKPFLK
jgi:hypothetical protein